MQIPQISEKFNILESYYYRNVISISRDPNPILTIKIQITAQEVYSLWAW